MLIIRLFKIVKLGLILNILNILTLRDRKNCKDMTVGGRWIKKQVKLK